MIYPPITYPAGVSDKEKILYELLVNNICFEYEKQLGEVKDFDVKFVTKEIPFGEGTALGLEEVNGEIFLDCPSEPNGQDLEWQSTLVAHELAHEWLGNYYGQTSKEHNNLVHYAGNTGQYMKKRRLWVVSWRILWCTMYYFDLLGLINDKDKIMKICATTKGIPNAYW